MFHHDSSGGNDNDNDEYGHDDDNDDEHHVTNIYNITNKQTVQYYCSKYLACLQTPCTLTSLCSHIGF